MVLKVDLQCSSCYKKIKKILCKFPQIRDQIYDEKQNTVTIIVVCCSPEKVRDKLYNKGGKTIKSIEIKEPPKKDEPKKPKDPEKPKTLQESKESKEPPNPPALPAFVPVCYPPMYPVGICCGQCYEGRTDGPCYHGHGRPVPSYYNYGYGPSGYSGNRGCYTSRCDYFSEENPSGCTIM
ncbi:heavy metal-associated isoprenylated plant protein 43-like isoform X5 [Camellia sinensis]|nr:heavy metal-associated isoprenylated plant protein 43-like isoform X5 [Camellia sinensis]